MLAVAVDRVRGVGVRVKSRPMRWRIDGHGVACAVCAWWVNLLLEVSQWYRGHLYPNLYVAVIVLVVSVVVSVYRRSAQRVTNKEVIK